MNPEKTNPQIDSYFESTTPNEVAALFAKHNDTLENLSKEDLIKIIAHMHDTIQEWDSQFWGLCTEQAQTLMNIGRKSMLSCNYNNDWDISHLKEAQN